MANESKKVLAIVGSYADAAGPGVYVCSFDPEQGSLKTLDEARGLQNPTFLHVNAETSKVYAITEGLKADGGRCGAIAAFDLDGEQGRLTLLNTENSVPSTTCHITLDQTGQAAIVSSYHGGMIGLSPVMADGRIGSTTEIHQHEGTSVLPVQDKPHTHSVFMDPSNRYAIACDLGLDRIFIYSLGSEATKLTLHREVSVHPGSGPRHFVFHPSLPYGYVINELNSTIIGFAFDAAEGNLTEIQSLSTLPEAYEGENATADIHISPDGQFLYGSNRGHDSIAVYAIDSASGRLTLVEHASVLGAHPRNFALSPDGRFAVVANRDTNNLVTFSRDAKTGRLTPAGHELSVSKPVCIKFVVLG